MLNIAFTGDIAFSKYFKNSHLNENLLSKKIVDFLSTSDYTVANVEAPITDTPITSGEVLVHVNGPEILPTLKKINANVWNIGTNHATDCGAHGISDTLKFAREFGATTIGAGLNFEQARKPLIIEKNGIKVGLLSCASRLAEGATEEKAGVYLWDDKHIKRDIKTLKNMCDHVVVISHGGEEFSQIPLPFARDKYKKYLKWGANIVVAHHPHVPQNYEFFDKKVAFYSLGNFIFDTDYQRTQRNTDIGVLLKISFEKNSFSFDSLSIKINREKNVVEETNPLTIFQNIDQKNYNKLIPLAEMDYSKNLWRKFINIKEENNTKSNFKFFKAKLKRFQPYERWGLIKVIIRRPFKRYKKCGNEIVKYILGE